MAWYDSYFGGTTTSTPTVNTSNSPPGQHVWEEDRREEPTVYTPSGNGQGQATQTPIVETPIVTTNEIINEKLPGNLPVIENLGSSNLEKLLTDEERKLNMLYELQNQWENTTAGKYPISSPFILTEDPSNTNPYGLGYHGATQYDNQGNIIGGTQMGDPGAVLLNAKAVSFGHPPVYGKPVLSGIGEELYNYDWTDGGDNPYGTIPNPEVIYFGEEGPSPRLEKLEGISRNYYGQPRDSDDPWDDPWANWRTAGGTDVLDQLAPGWWHQKTLEQVQVEEMERVAAGEGPATMTNLDPAYKEELSFDRLASPLHLGQTPQGIEESIHHPYSSAHKQFEQSYYGPDFGFRVSSEGG